MTDLKTLYEEDTAAWSLQQAAALRATARGGSNQPLDWENLAEEIESLGKSLRLGLRSQIARIIQHEVKLEHSPAIDPRNGWRRTIRQARVEIDRILEDSPSLRCELPRFIREETGRALELAWCGKAPPRLRRGVAEVIYRLAEIALRIAERLAGFLHHQPHQRGAVCLEQIGGAIEDGGASLSA